MLKIILTCLKTCVKSGRERLGFDTPEHEIDARHRQRIMMLLLRLLDEKIDGDRDHRENTWRQEHQEGAQAGEPKEAPEVVGVNGVARVFPIVRRSRCPFGERNSPLLRGVKHSDGTTCERAGQIGHRAMTGR